MTDNYQLITRGFQIMTEILAPYVCQQLEANLGRNWWQQGVLGTLLEHQRRDLPDWGDWGTLVDSLDVARCLILMDVHWNKIFKVELSREHRHWIKELITTRNKWAHKGSSEVTNEDAWRALDTMARLMEKIDTESTEEIRALVRKVRYGTSGVSTSLVQNKVATAVEKDADGGVLAETPRAGLLPWRQVVEPHPDVAAGRYRQAEFAADLAQVVRGTAEVEYQDPVEFFGRTYITEGMEDLLVQALKRVTGQGGEPVVQLKTAFGGGKTHSMLALYHLLRGQSYLEQLPHVQQLLAQAGLDTCPKSKVVALVGTDLNPSKVRRPPTFPGITIRTLWGEIAAQLAEQAGKPELYDLVRKSDRAAVPPGSGTLVELLDACGPCVILIDELVAYARKLYGAKAPMAAGTFDAVLTFVQELTEAVRASKDSMLVAAIPESDIEIGGEGGQKAMEILEHTFGRMEAIWKPVGAEEGFEIVRRRLFLPVHDEAGKMDVCRAFSEMYRQGGADFPIECKEMAYLERLQACYPIHPEVFDRLYGDWATLQRFQRTRGVLRLMAAVIHDLWIRQDASLLIMPGSIPLDNTVVREELTRYLSEGWNAVVETDIDGPRSLPYRIDAQNSRFGRYMAARRVARSIFLGSAPSVREQRVRGIQDVRARLGVVQPGEQVAVFNDALGHMGDRLRHLYSSNQRHWFDLQPNLRRTVEERAQQVSEDEVEEEIKRRLRTMRGRADFAGVHMCPGSSVEVGDEQTARLVVLAPNQLYRTVSSPSPAQEAALEYVLTRGQAPRLYRNMLAFVAPDAERYANLVQSTRSYLAWQSIVEDVDALNLDAFQRKEAQESSKTSNNTVNLQIQETYCWLLVPIQDGTEPITWEIRRLSQGDNFVTMAASQMRSSELLITKWAPGLLCMELDRWLWREQDYISIKQLWEHLCSYCYLPRLRDQEVLLDAIKEGLGSDEYFGYATGITGGGRFLALRLGDTSVLPDDNGFLVKAEVARKQLQQEAKEKPPADEKPPTGKTPSPTSTGIIGGGGVPPAPPTPSPTARKPRRFHGSVELNPTRLTSAAGQVADEVVQHLTALLGAKVTVTMEIQAEVPDGVPDDVMRIVTENCQALKFKAQGFEKQ